MSDHYLAVQCTSQTGSRRVTYRYHFWMGTRGQAEAGQRAAAKALKYQKCGWKTEISLHGQGYESEVSRHRRVSTPRRR